MSYYGYRWRYRRSRMTPGQTAIAAGVAVVLAVAAGHARAATHSAPAAAPAPDRAAAVAVAYARAQIGHPYIWGGVGPYGYDCSGLVMEAWSHAGVAIPRTSQEQWADLPHVSRPAAGELVFAPGSDGTWSAPGHVGMIVSPGHVVEAFETGTTIFVTSLAEFGATSGGVIGYAEVR